MRTELSYIDIEVAFGLGFAFIIHTNGQCFFQLLFSYFYYHEFYYKIFGIISFIYNSTVPKRTIGMGTTASLMAHSRGVKLLFYFITLFMCII